MLKATETAVKNKTDNEAVSETKAVKTTRRGRPPIKKSSSRKRGRPKGSTSKNKTTNRDREVKIALREKIKLMRAEMKSTKLKFREAIKNEKELVKQTRKELKEALKREQDLLKLFDLKDKVVATFANRWTAEQITKIQSPTKRRRRRKKTS